MVAEVYGVAWGSEDVVQYNLRENHDFARAFNMAVYSYVANTHEP